MQFHLLHLVSILDYHISNQAGLQSKESDIKLKESPLSCNVKSAKILLFIPENILEKVSVLNAFQIQF